MATPTRSEIMTELRDLQRDIDEVSSWLSAYLDERYKDQMTTHRWCYTLTQGRQKLGEVISFLREMGG